MIKYIIFAYICNNSSPNDVDTLTKNSKEKEFIIMSSLKQISLKKLSVIPSLTHITRISKISHLKHAKHSAEYIKKYFTKPSMTYKHYNLLRKKLLLKNKNKKILDKTNS